jgi:steroid 5-alpha reductase family enzyme
MFAFDPYNFISTLVICFAIQIGFFVLAATFKTDKVTDLSYSLTFIILALLLLFTNQTFFTTQIIIALLIITWGIRLAVYLFSRMLKIGRDSRFDDIRDNFLKFVGFWTLQAVSVWIIMLPSTVALSSETNPNVIWLAGLGLFVSSIGLIIETTADYQKYVFKNDPNNRGTWIQSGIWKYSRHPNYFGEMLVWWGLFIIGIGYRSEVYRLTILSPIYLTLLLLFVSGVPTLEKKYDQRYKDNEDYQQYKESTSLIVPLPPKTK